MQVSLLKPISYTPQIYLHSRTITVDIKEFLDGKQGCLCKVKCLIPKYVFFPNIYEGMYRQDSPCCLAPENKSGVHQWAQEGLFPKSHMKSQTPVQVE